MRVSKKTERIILVVLAVTVTWAIIFGINKINSLNECIDNNESQIAQLQNKVSTNESEAEEQLNLKQKNLSDYIRQLNELQEQLSDANGQIADQSATAEELTSRNSELQSKISELQKKISELEAELKKVTENNNMHLMSKIQYTKTEQRMLYKLVQCECGNSDIEHKRIITFVVLNRIKSGEFPDTIYRVLTQEGQFTSVTTFTAQTMQTPDSDTIKAVNEVLSGKAVDNSHGALYYYSPQYLSDKFTISWFESQNFLFEEYGHRFFK